MNDDYYVYVLRRLSGIPFYIGKGRGRRMHQHEQEAQGRRYKSRKSNIVRKFLFSGVTVPKDKVAIGLTCDQALSLERRLIAEIGRCEEGGPLVNLTSGGDGMRDPSPTTLERLAARNRARVWTPEARAKVSATLRAIGHGRQPKSAATRAKISHAKEGKKQGPRSKQAIANLRAAQNSPELIAKRSAYMLGRKLGPWSAEKRAQHKIRMQAIAAKQIGNRWITDGVNSTLIGPGASPLPGWRFGRILPESCRATQFRAAAAKAPAL
jgi:hypothetical protein